MLLPPSNLLPDHLRLSPENEAKLEKIRQKARELHEAKRKAREKRGLPFPLLPYECSWAFEEEFRRQN